MLPKTSKFSGADTPSLEYPWTWIALSPSVEYGMFYRNEKAAIKAANENFHNFPSTMKEHKVIVAKATTGWNVDE